ncbi:unnamed protein product [Cylicocyclus nassatus]|uniref:Uncharacterized protein n=1 Tax=Cylicocyclus nassatus TaxID=53992 RepID=A0AA36DS03_CYLNA|nr:unnamed protein product [Cylicocyclus nassatus]
MPALSDSHSGMLVKVYTIKVYETTSASTPSKMKMVFYFLLMPFPVYCGACYDIPIVFWAKYFREGFQNFCDGVIEAPLRMVFTMPLIKPLRRFVLNGTADDKKVRIFKVPNKHECRFMERLVTVLVKHIAEKHNSLKKTCKMFRKKNNFLCLPHWERVYYRRRWIIKPVLYCAFSNWANSASAHSRRRTRSTDLVVYQGESNEAPRK